MTAVRHRNASKHDKLYTQSHNCTQQLRISGSIVDVVTREIYQSQLNGIGLMKQKSLLNLETLIKTLNEGIAIRTLTS